MHTYREFEPLTCRVAYMTSESPGGLIVVSAKVAGNKLISIVTDKIRRLEFGMMIFFGLNID